MYPETVVTLQVLQKDHDQMTSILETPLTNKRLGDSDSIKING